MNQKSPQNSKRRPPSEKSSDDSQDADWGFDSDGSNPGVEKKLAVVLVVCLLAGFGFVLYQKYQLLQRNDAQASTDSSDVIEPTVDDEGAVEDDIAVLGAAAVTATSSDVSTTSTIESPFYGQQSEPESTNAVDEPWTLTQAQMPEQSFADTPADDQPAESESPSSFDPFASSSEPDPSPATPAPTPGPEPTIVWDEPAPKQSLPEDAPTPFEQAEPQVAMDEPSMAANEHQVEMSPFVTDDPLPATESPDPPVQSSEPMPLDEPGEPEPLEEPMKFVFEEPEVTEPASNGTLPAMPLEALSLQGEPQPFESAEPATPVAEQSAAPGETNTQTDAFDPFSSAEPQSQEMVETPSPAAEPLAEPFPFLAPPPRQAPPTEQSNVVTIEPPAWPGATSTKSATPEVQPQAPPAQERPFGEPPMLTLDSVESSPSPTMSERQQTPNDDRPPNPFSVDNGFGTENSFQEPVVSSLVAGQAVIGEREIIVSQSDSFWTISQREYGTSQYFTALAHYNRELVPQPEALRAGMKIKIPPPEVLESRFPELLPKRKVSGSEISPVSGTSTTDEESSGLIVDANGQHRYRVGEQDTLSSIAQKHLGAAARWPDIYELNRDQMTTPSTLKIGMVLKLPAVASQETVSPVSGFSR